MYPLAKTAELIVEELPSETIVYDTKRHRAHCLNQMAGLIWRYCDGQTSIEQMARRLSESLGTPVDQEVVRLGLRELNDCSLLVGESVEAHAVSRREVTKRLAAAGGALVAVAPTITSIVAPTPAMAQSGHDHGRGKGQGKGHGDGKGH